MITNASPERAAGVQSVERALALLVAVGRAEQPLALGALAQQVDLHPATAHRLLRTLVVAGFVSQDPATQRYGLGAELLALADAHRHRVELPELALPFLESLVAALGETVGLLRLDGEHTVVIARVLSQHPLRVHAPIGALGPLHATAVGKVLLAYLPEGAREAILATPLTAFTGQTITQPAALRAVLETVRAQGYAVGVDDYYEGVTTLAAPIYAFDGKVIAGLSVSGPSSRITAEYLPTIVNQVRTVAADLSAELGYRPH